MGTALRIMDVLENLPPVQDVDVYDSILDVITKLIKREHKLHYNIVDLITTDGVGMYGKHDWVVSIRIVAGKNYITINGFTVDMINGYAHASAPESHYYSKKNEKMMSTTNVTIHNKDHKDNSGTMLEICGFINEYVDSSERGRNRIDKANSVFKYNLLDDILDDLDDRKIDVPESIVKMIDAIIKDDSGWKLELKDYAFKPSNGKNGGPEASGVVDVDCGDNVMTISGWRLLRSKFGNSIGSLYMVVPSNSGFDGDKCEYADAIKCELATFKKIKDMAIDQFEAYSSGK